MPARAQAWEVSGFIGVTPSADLDRVASGLDQLSIRNGFTWGAQAARLFGPHWAAEAMWTEQSSALEIDTADETADLFNITIGQAQGNVVYHFGRADAKLRPFAFAGISATFFPCQRHPVRDQVLVGLRRRHQILRVGTTSGCEDTSDTSLSRSTTKTPVTSAIRSASVRARCSSSRSRPAPSCDFDLVSLSSSPRSSFARVSAGLPCGSPQGHRDGLRIRTRW